MISIKNVKTISNPMTDRPVAASACSLGFSASLLIVGRGVGKGTGVSGGLVAAAATSMPATGLPVLGLERIERPTSAPTAVAAKTQAKAYAFAAASARTTTQNEQHLTKWAFRGLEPWSDPA
ncbi:MULTISPECIES: hypothetical protein [Streptomyces]|nr:hypothetical protein [Streptomyces tsukubensis]AZK96383.1 hypothetical protein B7R87_22785 [Streptomyces tsukubensis]EIF92383.1 hypothetical protein [Streptomyces tsukubensis NRRL18488]